VIGSVLFDEETLRRRVKELGAAIASDYARHEPLLIGILNSSAIFLADLSRAVPIPSELDLIALTPYVPEATSRGVRFEKDLSASIEGRHCVLVEDVVDTGLTLQFVLRALRARAPASVAVCALLDRPQRRIADVTIAYRGFEIADYYVVGYGLDHRGRFRELPDIHLFEHWPNTDTERVGR
jgi:hypoxanthine phosphoribosyltransferase